MTSKHKNAIAIDFDGVVHQYSKGFSDGTIYDDPMPGAREAIAALAKRYRIIIYTVRMRQEFRVVQEPQLRAWLQKHGIYYDELTAEKPLAVMFVDDNAMRFTNWPQALREYERIKIERGYRQQVRQVNVMSQAAQA